MLLKIAWRNIGRNKRRSLIVLVSMAVGLAAIVLDESLSVGMIQQIYDNQIGSYVSDMQIHRKGFNDNKVISALLPDPARVDSVLKRTEGIQAFTPRVVTYGLVSSARNSSGVALVGIRPETEARVTTVSRSMVEGRFLSGANHEVIIGRKLAEKLNVGVGDKVVGMASALSGAVGSDLFRVVGIFETVSSDFDRSFAFIGLANAQQMLELGDRFSGYAMVMKDRRNVEQVKEKLRASLGGDYEVLSYADLLPLMLAQMEVYNESIYIVYVIIGLAMIFGIINTMLMSVFERIREFGVLMAVGMKNSRLFGMILLEACVLGVLGSLAGLILSLAICLPLVHSGINLSTFSEGLAAFGTGSVIYPVITVSGMVKSMLVIPVIAVIGALYPALKAVRLVPVQAVRYV